MEYQEGEKNLCSDYCVKEYEKILWKHQKIPGLLNVTHAAHVDNAGVEPKWNQKKQYWQTSWKRWDRQQTQSLWNHIYVMPVEHRWRKGSIQEDPTLYLENSYCIVERSPKTILELLLPHYDETANFKLLQQETDERLIFVALPVIFQNRLCQTEETSLQ